MRLLRRIFAVALSLLSPMLTTAAADVTAVDNTLVLTLFFETHSWSEDNERGIATGWLPGKLSARGCELAGELGARYRHTDIAVVFVSDLRRAVETATRAFDGSSLPIVQDVRLRECNYGDLNGGPVAVHHGRRAKFIDRPYPNGQSYGEVREQVRAFLLDAARAYRSCTILVIGHAATRWSLDSLLHGTPLEELVDAPFNWKPGWTYAITTEQLRGLETFESIDRNRI